jgi:hypothetical protein
VTPKLGGKCRHAQPLVSTNTIAVNTARSSTRDIPPPWGRVFAGGINGSTNAHNSSGTSRRDNSSTTTGDHGRKPSRIQVRHALMVGIFIDRRIVAPPSPRLCTAPNASPTWPCCRRRPGHHRVRTLLSHRRSPLPLHRPHGLGLAIVKHVAANHGGEVHLWSKPGTASAFTLGISRPPSHLPAIRERMAQLRITAVQ